MYLNSRNYYFNPVLFPISLEWKAVILDLGKVCLLNTKTSKQIEVGISIYIGASVLFWNGKAIFQLLATITTSTFILWLFVWAFSKSLIVDCVVFTHAVMKHYF